MSPSDYRVGHKRFVYRMFAEMLLFFLTFDIPLGVSDNSTEQYVDLFCRYRSGTSEAVISRFGYLL